MGAQLVFAPYCCSPSLIKMRNRSFIIFLLLALHCLSILCTAADFSIQVGDLATVDTANAISFMSGITMDKGKWLQLGNSTAHPEALLRFMVLGAPNPLVFPNSSWGFNEEEDVRKMGRLLATRDASIAESRFHQANKDLGSLHINAWMLGFACVDSVSPCKSLAPVALVNRVSETSGSACIEVTVVWDKMLPGRNSTLVANTITAKLINVSKEEKIIKPAEGHLDKFSLRVLSKGMEACPNTFLKVALRSSLDATYNLGPYACYHINSKFQRIAGKEYLLVLGSIQISTSSGDFGVDGGGPPRATSYKRQQNDVDGLELSTPICIKGWLQKYKQVELWNCEESPLLIVVNSPDQVFAACQNSSSSACLQLNPHNLIYENDTECDDDIFLAFRKPLDPDNIHKVKTIMLSTGGFNYIQGSSSNYGVTTGSLCETAGDVLIKSSRGDSDDQFGYNNNPLAVDGDALELLLTGLNNRYAQAHTDAFQLQNGAPTDFGTAILALAGAFISVLTATIPFTNVLLTFLIIVSGSLHSSRYTKMVVVCVVNMVVAIVCYGAVVVVMVSEKQRVEEFKTWAVIAEKVVVNEMGLELQAVYVVNGNSVYKSRLLAVIWLMVSILVLLVGGMTYWRCRDVLKKLKLIKERTSSGSNAAIFADNIDDYRAIEMGTVEYMQLLPLQLHIDGSPHAPVALDAATSPDHAPVALDAASQLPIIDHGHATIAKLTFKQAAWLAWGLGAFKNASKTQ